MGQASFLKRPIDYRSFCRNYGALVEASSEITSHRMDNAAIDTLFVDIYAGSGCGKSGTRALVFGALKAEGANAEEIHEIARGMWFAKRHLEWPDQFYITISQLHQYHVLN